MDNNQEGNKAPTAFLVDLVSNRKIPVATPRCRVGRDDLNDIVISGDQSISRFHFIISFDNGEFTVQDAKSRHGTFLNGNQLTVSEPIKDGDVLKVGVSLFWFVVEGAQSENPPADSPAAAAKAAAVTEAQSLANDKVAFRSGGDLETTQMPSMGASDATQELARPDAALMDKLEQAANSIKMPDKAEDKPAPKASLASLLASADNSADHSANNSADKSNDAAAEDKEAERKKEQLAALAARDKELLEGMDEESREVKPADSDQGATATNIQAVKAPSAQKAEEAAEPAAVSEAVSEAASETVAEPVAEVSDAPAESVSESTTPEPPRGKKARESRQNMQALRAAQAEAEKSAEEQAAAAAAVDDDGIPKVRPTNKPSDTMTLEAMAPLPVKQEEESKAQADSDLLEPKAESTDDLNAESKEEGETQTAPESLTEAPPEVKSESQPEESKSEESKSEERQTEEAESQVEPQVEPQVESQSQEVKSEEEKAEEPKAEEPKAEEVQANAELMADSAESEAPAASAEAEAQIEAAAHQEEKVEEPVTAEISDDTAGHKLNGANGTGASKNGDSTSESSVKSSDFKVLAEASEQDVAKYIKAGASTVPDWCKRYFSDEIAKLNGELGDLNEQVRQAQNKIREVETRVAMTRGIRNTLLTTTGDELVEACGKVLALLGWKTTISDEDKHELSLEVEDKQPCIARVIWTTTKAERSHLGQLSISQTRYWMEKGIEPKGIIIVSKISDSAPSAVGDSPEEVELNDYAAKRNVCLMSTLQLLSLYKEIALADASPEKLRNAIINASGWLPGHNLEPGTADVTGEDEASGQNANKLSSLLSA